MVHPLLLPCERVSSRSRVPSRWRASGPDVVGKHVRPSRAECQGIFTQARSWSLSKGEPWDEWSERVALHAQYPADPHNFVIAAPHLRPLILNGVKPTG